jgi:adenylate kinase
MMDNSDQAKLTLIFGISGVGKTYTAEKWADTNPEKFMVVNASDLMRDAYPQFKNGEELRDNPADFIIDDLFGAVIDRLPAIRRQYAGKTILMPMHSVFENPDGVHDVPAGVISAMQPDQIYFIEEPPEVILQRRQNDPTRNRPCDMSVEEIAERQKRAMGNLEKFNARKIKSGEKLKLYV